MRACVIGPIVGLLMMCGVAHCADPVESTVFEQRFAQLEPLPAQQVPGPRLAAPLAPGPQFAAPPPAQPIAPQAQDALLNSPEVICRESPYRTDAWAVDFDLIPTQSSFTEGIFGSWPDDVALAFRLKLGYEDEVGTGMRMLFWVFGQDVDTLPTNVDLTASTFHWDIYRRLYIEDSELMIGGGPVGGHLRFEFPDLDESSRFRGGGVSFFADGFFALSHYAKMETGMIARARLSLLEGKWNDSGTTFIDDTDHDSVMILDLGWGMELRRRFGRDEERYWLLRMVSEFQRWDSAWLTDFNSSAMAFVGMNISFGLAW